MTVLHEEEEERVYSYVSFWVDLCVCVLFFFRCVFFSFFGVLFFFSSTARDGCAHTPSCLTPSLLPSLLHNMLTCDELMDGRLPKRVQYDRYSWDTKSNKFDLPVGCTW